MLVDDLGAKDTAAVAGLVDAPAVCPVAGVGQAIVLNAGFHCGTHSDVTVFEFTADGIVTDDELIESGVAVVIVAGGVNVDPDWATCPPV